VPSWIGRAVTRGILTSRYPRVPASEPETPTTARAPVPPAGGPVPTAAVLACPVEAISPEGVDQGRCVRCARCLSQRFRFDGPVEAAVGARAELLSPGGARTGVGRRPPAALAPLGRSLHLFLVDVGSCNACNLEVLALANPFYDAQRLGLFFTNSPRHADVLLVVGVPTESMVEPLLRAYEAMPGPKAVVAIGACPISGGAFRGGPGLRASLEGLVPVDVYLPGCPPTPIQILDAILALAGRGRREG
jgi:Ni,Fe-hydrogenase III small subunit